MVIMIVVLVIMIVVLVVLVVGARSKIALRTHTARAVQPEIVNRGTLDELRDEYDASGATDSENPFQSPRPQLETAAMREFTDYVVEHRRTVASWHEPAHACIAIRLGVSVKRTELFPGLDSGCADGITVYDGSDFRNLNRADAIVTYLAGPLAEKRIGERDWLKGDRSDLRHVDKILRGSGLSLAHLIARTEQMLAEEWGSISLLQHALYYKRLLVGDEIIEASRKWRP